MTDQQSHTITLDGTSYPFSDLTQAARDTLESIQFVEAKLQQLRAELAVCQTAHVSYACTLKAELEQKASL